MPSRAPDRTRRALLYLAAGLPAAVILAGRIGPARAQATPTCVDADDPTPSSTEGPYFTPDSPERTVLREADTAGSPIILSGRVLSLDCRPVAGALVDLWQCDGNGAYDNDGYRLRGHQFADADGRYRFETVVPGLYPGRTRHFHVKVQAPSQPILTTQLYLPDEPANQRDRIFRPELLVTLTDIAAFDFVVEA